MSELYLTYCKRLITVINSMLDGDKNAYSRRKKQSVSTALNIKAIGISKVTKSAIYSEGDLLKLRDLKCRLIAITTKGGKND